MSETEREQDRRAVTGSAVRVVIRRLLPLLLLMYVLAFLDRSNIGFAKDAYQADTGLSDAAYAFGAGVFFLGYVVLEIPSNLILRRVGARVWMSRIMVTWGIIATAMVFAHTAAVFYALRFLLGVAEAGFFPGIVFYLSTWVPAAHRAKVMGVFYFGAPLSFIFGGPLSGALLDLHQVAGLAGWQWMFAVEGLLALLVGVLAFFYLVDRPDQARWLSAKQREALTASIAAEAAEATGPERVLPALRNGRVLYLGLVYFLIQVSVYGVSFYLPTQIAALAGRDVGLVVGLLTAVPWICAMAGTVIAGRVSDRTGRRTAVAATCLLVGGVGIAGSAAAGLPALALVALCFAATGFIAVQPTFWTLPAGFLTGAAAASGIALINSIGSLGGFVAPNIKNAVDTVTGSTTGGLYALAIVTVVGAILVAFATSGRSADFPAEATS